MGCTWLISFHSSVPVYPLFFFTFYFFSLRDTRYTFSVFITVVFPYDRQSLWSSVIRDRFREKPKRDIGLNQSDVISDFQEAFLRQHGPHCPQMVRRKHYSGGQWGTMPNHVVIWPFELKGVNRQLKSHHQLFWMGKHTQQTDSLWPRVTVGPIQPMPCTGQGFLKCWSIQPWCGPDVALVWPWCGPELVWMQQVWDTASTQNSQGCIKSHIYCYD